MSTLLEPLKPKICVHLKKCIETLAIGNKFFETNKTVAKVTIKLSHNS